MTGQITPPSKIGNIMRDLERAQEADTRTLPERHFREIFLPLFAGVEKLPYDVTLHTWASVAGGFFSKVKILDEAGQVLFEVPPLMDHGAINPVSDEEIPLSHVVESAKQYSEISPIDGSNYLSRELEKRSLLMRKPANVLGDIKTWNEIFARYGYPLIEDIPSEETAQQSTTDNDNCEFAPL